MLTREKELLLALVEYVRLRGHAPECCYYTRRTGAIECDCGFQHVMSTAAWFTRNEPV